ncbi:hypothetical protein [Methanomethylovorans sp.]|uniref:hypothetical protein n=1 Tax=Methanomethylovorans sp. TaxID=2758717 RepID=UPI00351C1263
MNTISGRWAQLSRFTQKRKSALISPSSRTIWNRRVSRSRSCLPARFPVQGQDAGSILIPQVSQQDITDKTIILEVQAITKDKDPFT